MLLLEDFLSVIASPEHWDLIKGFDVHKTFEGFDDLLLKQL